MELSISGVLFEKFIECVKAGLKFDVKVLYGFSTISLKKKRLRKKFEQQYYRYVPEHISEQYKSLMLTYCVYSAFKTFSLDLSLNPPHLGSAGSVDVEKPNGELCYYDHYYGKVAEAKGN